ncbi:hypothetical protein BDB01DRAFT_264515 [Pilobolus umbonatus]|nr:hypothetical protein BDB01DRAFT_264515 [Pilobolus umbonatus]
MPLKKPAKRRRLVRKEEEGDTSIGSLITEKKKLLERQQTTSELEQLFGKLNKQLAEEEASDDEKIVPEEMTENTHFDEDYFLQSDTEELEIDIHESVNTYLDKEAQKNLEDALEQTETLEKKDDRWHTSFFRPGKHSIREPIFHPEGSTLCLRSRHITKMAEIPEQRAFLLDSGCIQDWYLSGWKCPSHVYQWLFEVAALDQNRRCALNALNTLRFLWTQNEIGGCNSIKHITMDTFLSVLSAYHAEPSTLLNDPINSNPSPLRHLPIIQLGWVIRAFSSSMQLWPGAYLSSEIRHAIRLLLQISLDRRSGYIMQDIQTSIDHGLLALKRDDWIIETKMIAHNICDVVSSTKAQYCLLESIKPILTRSRYLKRMIAMTCLEKCLEREDPGSVNSIVTDQGFLQQIHTLFSHSAGFFQQNPKDIDYDECVIRIGMLDAAIGTDIDELRTNKDTVLSMVDSMRSMSLQIGSRLGILSKTLANEMIQRVWARLTYMIGNEANSHLS